MSIVGGKKYAVFTMDVEEFSDTECVSNSGIKVGVDMLDGLDEYVKLLEKHGIRATMFTVCHAAQIIKDKVSKYVSRGHSVALHGYTHTPPVLLDDVRFREETLRAKHMLENEFGTEVRGYRAPCFGLDNTKLNILRELGFKYDSSHLDFAAARHHTDIDMSDFKEILSGVFCRKGFYEFGITCRKFMGKSFPISGGGYVRMGNWNFMKAAIGQYLSENNYYVFYLHPFEMSKEKVPQIKNLKFYDKFYLNYGINTYKAKIETIILMLKAAGYEFVTFEELTDIMECKA